MMSGWRRMLPGIAVATCPACTDALPPPTIDRLIPNEWRQSRDAPVPVIVEGGNFFLDLRTDMISPTGTSVHADFTGSIGIYDLTDVRWVSNTRLEANAPANVAPGVYDLDVVTPAGDTASLAGAVRVLATSPEAWWDVQFNRRLRIAFDRMTITEPLIEFPVLVRLDVSRIDYSTLQPNGEDLRFLDDDGQTILAYEIEAWDPAGESLVWVRVPRIDPTPVTEFIWIYHDNPNIGAAEDAAAVWSAGYRNVWHMGNPTPDQLDSTANGTPALASGTIDPGVLGPIGDAVGFPGAAPSALTADDGMRNGGTALTVAAWFRLDSNQAANWYGIAQKGRQSDLDWHGLWLQQGMIAVGGWSSYSSRGGNIGPTPVVVDTWYHATLTFDGTDAKFFLDGVAVAGPSPRFYFDVADPITIGTDGYNGNYLHGRIDEVRFADVERSDAWIAAQFASMTYTFASYRMVEIGP